MEYELCACGEKAKWAYMPGSVVYCEQCVPRGCECNNLSFDVNDYYPPLDNPDVPEGIEGIDWKKVEGGKRFTYLDPKGREYPCCEFMFDEDGYEKEEEDK